MCSKDFSFKDYDTRQETPKNDGNDDVDPSPPPTQTKVEDSSSVCVPPTHSDVAPACSPSTPAEDGSTYPTPPPSVAVVRPPPLPPMVRVSVGAMMKKDRDDGGDGKGASSDGFRQAKRVLEAHFRNKFSN